MRFVVVEAGDVGETLAARMHEGLADLAVDLLERLDAIGREGRRDHRDVLLAGLRKLGHMLDGIGLEPFLAAEDRLEGGVDVARLPAKPLPQQPRGLLALAMVGVAFHQIALGHAVIRGHQHVGAGGQRGIDPLDRLRERVDIARPVEIFGRGAGGGRALLRHQRAEEGVVRGGARGARVLRVKREEQDLLAARLHHPLDHRGGRGIAIAHAEIDHHAGAEARLDCLAQLRDLALGDRHQRAFIRLGVPDRAVIRPRGEGALRQDDELQQRLPFPRRDVDHPLVREEFVQIAPHRPVVGRIRRAEIGKEHPDLRLRHRRVVCGGVGKARVRVDLHLMSCRFGNHPRLIAFCPRVNATVVIGAEHLTLKA
ncbi:hypothetical protein SDC9_06423 [bioreactor metagenome]|uniref:Uncharacterized protein n=1 Tax=bioreactor metagenome TaxID=1076179 RepID=A0A644T4L2_9ZZZZ